VGDLRVLRHGTWGDVPWQDEVAMDRQGDKDMVVPTLPTWEPSLCPHLSQALLKLSLLGLTSLAAQSAAHNCLVSVLTKPRCGRLNTLTHTSTPSGTKQAHESLGGLTEACRKWRKKVGRGGLQKHAKEVGKSELHKVFTCRAPSIQNKYSTHVTSRS